MSLRSMLGLCEHKWVPTGGLIEKNMVRISDSKKLTTGYTDVRECEKCGQTRGFKL